MYNSSARHRLLAATAMVLALGAQGAAAATYTVSNTAAGGAGSLNQAILDANAAGGGDIVFASSLAGQTINVGANPLAAITAGTGANRISIDGAGAPGVTISGGGTSRVFFVLSGDTSFSNLTIADGAATGGAGGAGANGGGGGMGAGGAIFVNAGATSLNNVTFSNNHATGGAGGGHTDAIGGGGGGGLGGSGGGGGAYSGGGGGGYSGGGGGGGGTSEVGPNSTAGAGGAGPGGAGGSGSAGAGGQAGANGGGAGGGTGSVTFFNYVTGGGGGGGGLGGGAGGTGGSGEFRAAGGGGGGGGGLAGGAGGTDQSNSHNGTLGGGGAGAGVTTAPGYVGPIGGVGGDFGGGGGNGSDVATTANTPNGGYGGGGGAGGRANSIQGAGGFGGGGGEGNFVASGGVGGGGGSTEYAGGGAGFGGAVFVRDGASLTVANGSFTGGAVTGGLGSASVANGAAAGSDIFLSSSTTTFAPTGTLVINGTIADSSASSVLAGQTYTPGSGTGGRVQVTSGVVVLNGANTFARGAVVLGGELVAGHNSALGTGTATVNGGTLSYADGVTIANLVSVGASGAKLNVASGTAVQQGNLVGGAGDGGFEKTGAGTLEFRSLSAYTGPTTISEGRVYVAPGSRLSPGVLTITNGVLEVGATTSPSASVGTRSLEGTGTGGIELAQGAMFRVIPGAGADFGGYITGAGNFALINGSQTLSGAVTITGDTSVASTANLTLRNQANFAGTITDSGVLTLNNSTVSGVISGAGSVTVSGGVTTLSGANTYTGGTTVAAGTLRLAGNGAAGAGAITTTGSTIDYASGVTVSNPVVINSNTTRLNIDAGSATQAGVISETGGVRPLEKTGAGTLILTADNTYTGVTTVSAGTLQLGAGGATGSVSGNIVNNAAVVFNRSGSSTYAGAISGSGSVTKTGSGGLTLSGANTYTGGTTVSQGGLEVSGSIIGLTTLAQQTSLVVTSTGSVRAISGNQGSIINYGLIETPLLTAGTTATVNLGNMGSSLVNYGTIRSYNGHAIQGGAGADNLTLQTGSNIIGRVALGGGTSDTVNLLGSLNVKSASQTFGDIYEAESVTVGTGYWTLNKELGSDRVNILAGATLELDSVGAAPGEGGYVSSSGPVLTVVNNGALVQNTDDTRLDIYADNLHLSGSGTLELKGGGTLQYGANVTLTGATTVTNGSLIVTGDNISSPITVGAQGTLRVGAAFSAPDADGYVTLIGGGGTTGSVTGNIVNNGAVTFDRANDTTYAGVMSGAGTLTKTGAGVLSLTGANTYTGATTVSAGGLTVSAPLASSGISLATNTSLVFTGPNAMTYGGVISGTGVVSKMGAGTLTLSGANTNANGVNVNAGKIVLSGSMVGPVFVTPGASFEVTSTGSARAVGGSGATVSNAGTIATPLLTTGSAATVNFSALDNTLNNSGVIRSYNGNAVRFGAGNDTLNLSTGSSIIGRVDMGGGTDTINLAGSVNTKSASQSLGNIFGSEALNVNSGYWTLVGEVEADVVTVAGGATFEVDDVNGQPDGAFISSNGADLSIVNNGAVIVNTADTRTDIYADNLHLSGAGTFALTGGGTVQFGQNVTLTGGATVANGTLVVTGDNLATPITVGAQGALRVGAAYSAPDADGYVNIVAGGGTTGSLSGNIVNNGAVTFDRAGASTYAGVISGSGALTKSGSGTLTLTGQNTLTGGTTIAAGTLQIGDGGATGALSGPIVNNGALVFNKSTGGSLSNISGSGSLRVQAGNLTLSGVNTYTGGTTVTGGSLAISGAFSGDIVNNATVNFDLPLGGSRTYSGVISGTGYVNVTGIEDEQLTLTGANTFTGGLAVYSHNTLQIGAGGTTGSVVSNIINEGSVAFNRSDNTTYAGVISGAGRLSKAGAGVLTLSGANTYTGATTVTGGGLVVSAPFASSGVSLAGGTNLTFTGPNAMTYAGVVSGAGSLVKSGAGLLTLSGANSHTGGTTVQAGGLRVTGSLVGGTTLASGTTLEIAAGGSARAVNGNGAFIINAGTIETPLITTGSLATISLGDGGSTVENAGLIRSYNGNAARFGAGADTLILKTGSSIVGRVDMGGGNDTVILQGTSATKSGTQTLGLIFGSDALNVNSGYWTLNKEVEADFVSVANTATLELDSVGAAPGDGGFISGNQTIKTVAVSGAIIQNTSDARLDDGANNLHITGSGTVELKGGGALQYGANTTLTGATTVTNGLLVVTGDNIASAINVGAQGVVRIGAAYSAPDVDGFVTLVSGGGTTGSVAGNIANNGAVIFDRANASTYGGVMSGTGAVTKSGAGVLTLSGANTYTGATTVTAGGLVVSAPFASSGVSLASGTGLTFTGPNALTYGGVVSGAGGLTKAGSGVVTLSGANTYTGATTVGAGGLTVTGSIASQSVSVASGATFTFGASANQTWGGVVSGAGSLAKTGAGSLTLTGANTYTGATTISGGSLILASTLGSNVTVNQGGTLQIGTGGTIGDLTGDLRADGTVIFNRSDNYLFAGDFSGTGSLIKRGAGLLTLDGLYTFSGSTVIEAGSIKITQLDSGGSLVVGDGANIDLSGSNQTVGGLTGGAGSSINIEDATLTINQQPGGSPTVFNGTLSGDGALVVTGSGVIDLAGTNTYTGPTTVNGGTLKINGSISSPVTVNNGGTLGGSGTINGAVTIGSGGSISPGNSPGVTNIAGPLTLASGAHMIVEVDPTATITNDRINVTAGAATITAGAILDVRPLGAIANYDRVSDYTILTATGGVTGTFGSNVTSSMALLTPSVSYSTNEVKLRLIRNDISFASLADTTNQAAVAAAAEATGPSGAAYGALIGQDEAGARAGYDALSGEVYGAAGSLMIDDGRHQRATLLRHAASSDQGAWASMHNGEATIDAGAGFGEANNKSFGLTGGGQTTAGGWNLGFALGFGQSDVTVDARSSVTEAETLRAGVYGGSSFGAWRVRLGADLAQHDFEAKRGIAFPTVTQSVAAEYDGSSRQLFGELAYAMDVAGGSLEPFVEVAGVWAKTDAFTETGGALGLNVAEQDRNVTFATVGARFSGSYDTGGAVVRPQLSLAWRRASGDIEGTSSAAFGTSNFTVTGAGLAKDTALIDAGVGFDITSAVTGSVSYSGAVSSDAKDHAVRAGFFVRF